MPPRPCPTRRAAPLLRLALAFLILGAARASAAPSILGFTFPSWWKDAYQFPETSKSLKLLAETGAGWVVIVPTRYLKSAESSRIEITDGTATDDSLRHVMREARKLGLKVLLKPHVDEQGGGPRALLRPKDPKAWFADYRPMTLHYARLAAEEKADMFAVGTELFSLSGFVTEWEDLIRETRAVYPGPLTYAANWYDFAKVTFWGKLDYIGVDGYFPLAGGKNRRLLKLSWQPYLAGLKACSRAYGKPLLFTEMGLASQEGAGRRPWDYREFGPLDLEEQKAYFEAFLDVFDPLPEFAGLLQWAWELKPDAGGPRDKSMTVQGKPALDVLKAYFKRRAAPPPPPAPKPALGSAAQRVRKALAVPGFK